MKKLTQLEKFGLIAAIIIACTFFYMRKVYEPQEKKFKQTVATLNKVIGEVKGLKQIPPLRQAKGELESATKELEALEEKLKSTTIHSGTPQEVTRLLRHINEVIADSGLRIASLTPGGPVEDALLQLKWTRYQVSLNGSFRGFLYLLHALKDMPDPVRVDQVELLKDSDDSLSITFTLLI